MEKMRRYLKEYGVENILSLPFKQEEFVLSGSFLLYALCSGFEFQPSVTECEYTNTFNWQPRDLDIFCINKPEVIKELFDQLNAKGYGVRRQGILRSTGDYEDINPRYITMINWNRIGKSKKRKIEDSTAMIAKISKLYRNAENLTYIEGAGLFPNINVIIIADDDNVDANIFKSKLLDFDVRILVNQYANGQFLVGYPDDVTSLKTSFRGGRKCCDAQHRLYKYCHRGIEMINRGCSCYDCDLRDGRGECAFFDKIRGFVVY
jgi:hypothetical protein